LFPFFREQKSHDPEGSPMLQDGEMFELNCTTSSFVNLVHSVSM